MYTTLHYNLCLLCFVCVD